MDDPSVLGERAHINRKREVGEFIKAVEDEINKISDSQLRLEFAEFIRAHYNIPPRVTRLDSFLKALSSVLTIMPDPLPPARPWLRDVAALKGDMATIGQDAWAVIARHENERRRQEG